MRIHDALSGALLAALAAAILATVGGYPDIPGQKIGAGAFPGLLGALLLGCALLLLARGVRDLARDLAAGRRESLVAIGEWVRSPAHALRFGAVVAALVFYLVASEALGFLPTAFLALTGLYTAFGVRLRIGAPIAAALSLFVFAIFYLGLKVPLPWGVLRGPVLGG